MVRMRDRYHIMTHSTAAIAARLLLAAAILSAALSPAWDRPGVAPLNDSTWIAPDGSSAALPALKERQERSVEKFVRSASLTLPAVVLEWSPVTYGIVIHSVQDNPSLSSLFVYTQTTSSRL